MPDRRQLLMLAAGLCAAAAARAAGPSAAKRRDVLDTPAAPSALAAAGLLNGLAVAGRRLVGVGQRGHVLYSDDAGQRWQQAEVPVSADLTAVCFPTPTTGWAVGHDGVVLRSDDAGRRWTRQLDGRRIGPLVQAWYEREASASLADQPERAAAWVAEARRIAAQGADVPLLDVWFEDERSGWVVGAFGMLLHTRDGGSSWEPRLHLTDNPKALHLYAVRGIGGDLYLAGEQGLLRRLDRASGSFRAIAVPYEGTLFGVVGAAGVLMVHGLRGTALRSADGGASWQAVATGVSVGLTAAIVDGRGRFVLVSQAGQVLRSSDGGASFTAAPLERPVPAAAVAAVDGALVIAGPRGVHALALP
jgi:photosystem II stability/assembly factor-like uncharacterized protein